jgi:hypothetical protein
MSAPRKINDELDIDREIDASDDGEDYSDDSSDGELVDEAAERARQQRLFGPKPLLSAAPKSLVAAVEAATRGADAEERARLKRKKNALKKKQQRQRAKARARGEAGAGAGTSENNDSVATTAESSASSAWTGALAPGLSDRISSQYDALKKLRGGAAVATPADAPEPSLFVADDDAPNRVSVLDMDDSAATAASAASASAASSGAPRAALPTPPAAAIATIGASVNAAWAALGVLRAPPTSASDERVAERRAAASSVAASVGAIGAAAIASLPTSTQSAPLDARAQLTSLVRAVSLEQSLEALSLVAASGVPAEGVAWPSVVGAAERISGAARRAASAAARTDELLAELARAIADEKSALSDLTRTSAEVWTTPLHTSVHAHISLARASLEATLGFSASTLGVSHEPDHSSPLVVLPDTPRVGSTNGTTTTTTTTTKKKKSTNKK